MRKLKPANDNSVADPASAAATRLPKSRRRKLSSPPDEPWAWFTIACLSSKNMQMMSRTGRLILDRLIVEHYKHRCHMNGHLIVTYADFVRVGARRQSIKQAIEELSAAGLIRVTVGTFASADLRRPNRYTLTFYSADGYEATNDWTRVMVQYLEARLALIRKKYRKRRRLREKYLDAA